MAETLAEVFSKCDNDGCRLSLDLETAALISFTDAITKEPSLSIWTDELSDDGDALIIRNHKYKEGETGAFVRIPVSEIITKPTSQILAVIRSDRKPRILDGITRIVGYYSRMSNWNASKVGELRDRAQGVYKFSKTRYGADHNRDRVVDNLHA